MSDTDDDDVLFALMSAAHYKRGLLRLLLG